VDLTHRLWSGAPTYPGDPPVEFRTHGRLEEVGYNITQVMFGVHSGTHLDVPCHCFGDGCTVECLDLEKCIGPAHLVHLEDKGPGSSITLQDLQADAGWFAPGGRILLHTGWSERYGTEGFYQDFPAIEPDAARWMVERGIVLLGIEQPSVHPDKHREIHEIILGSEIVLVESMANLDRIERDDFRLIVLPMNLDVLDGSPVRAVAVEE
jgi:arylformamidase